MMESSVMRVAGKFGIRANRIKKIRAGIYKIGTYGGANYSLKRMPMSQAELRWVDRTLQAVRSHGYRQLAWRRPGRPEGRRLSVSDRKATYVLSPWIGGRQPSPLSKQDMMACGSAIARFHAAGSSMAGNTRTGQTKWQPEWRMQRRVLQRAYAQSRRGSLSLPVNRLLKRHGSEMLRLADQSGRMLKRASSLQRPKAVLCHGDGGPSNFIRNAAGTYLLDFETLQLNHRAYDLFKLIYNSCKDHHWNFSTARAILDGYRRVSKLRKQDYAMLKAWLRFPRTSYMVLLPGSRIPRTKGKLQWAVASERKISRFLQQLDRYAATHSK